MDWKHCPSKHGEKDNKVEHLVQKGGCVVYGNDDGNKRNCHELKGIHIIPPTYLSLFLQLETSLKEVPCHLSIGGKYDHTKYTPDHTSLLSCSWYSEYKVRRSCIHVEDDGLNHLLCWRRSRKILSRDNVPPTATMNNLFGSSDPVGSKFGESMLRFVHRFRYGSRHPWSLVLGNQGKSGIDCCQVIVTPEENSCRDWTLGWSCPYIFILLCPLLSMCALSITFRHYVSTIVVLVHDNSSLFSDVYVGVGDFLWCRFVSIRNLNSGIGTSFKGREDHDWRGDQGILQVHHVRSGTDSSKRGGLWFFDSWRKQTRCRTLEHKQRRRSSFVCAMSTDRMRKWRGKKDEKRSVSLGRGEGWVFH